MKSNIRQCGVIESIRNNRARIRITRSSACDSCEASAGCTGKHGKDFHINVVDDRFANYKPGDRVHVEIPTRHGRQAVLIGFGLPLVIFVATLLILHYAAIADETAALAAIAVLAVYYLIIYMFRKRVNRHFAIHLAE